MVASEKPDKMHTTAQPLQVPTYPRRHDLVVPLDTGTSARKVLRNNLGDVMGDMRFNNPRMIIITVSNERLDALFPLTIGSQACNCFFLLLCLVLDPKEEAPLRIILKTGEK